MMADLTVVEWDWPATMMRLVTGQTIEVRPGDTITIDEDEDLNGHCPIVSCSTMRIREECDDRIIGIAVE